MERYGFVYVWFDRKHKRYYVGSHWGHEKDGYVCSSKWMKDAKRLRPKDFKRRVVARVYTTYEALLEEEDRWLAMIKPEEKGKRYYNLRLRTARYWHTFENTRLATSQKISKSKTGKKRKPFTEEHRRRLSAANYRRYKNNPNIKRKKDPKFINTEL